MKSDKLFEEALDLVLTFNKKGYTRLEILAILGVAQGIATAEIAIEKFRSDLNVAIGEAKWPPAQ